ncbi:MULTISPECIES: SRPBCC family protein [Pimelobacter]|uniref:SRPBCC family protein n=1 Tax=Pimelobacter TaxID=2044 RepID=UPI001C048139|nr:MULTISPECIES: SRPBCC family protein [Pimelobacter]MBU2696579.1 polyketide cyclase [Pimelobacter sp. 30-1]UUW87628.1 SRPBCC family protein [Pimelobacter simplex]UUW97134.1 SRPBCC family protein [Pimelobacter simplex]
MTTTDAPALHEQIEIAAAPADVWSLVADVTRMAEWSPQVTSTRLADPDAPAGVGTRFTNRNAHGELTWTTHAEITRYDAGRSLAFRIDENYVTWSFELEPTTDGGTRLHQRRDAPEGISELSRELTEAFMGGQEAFTVSQRAGMRTTLEGIRGEAETR